MPNVSVQLFFQHYNYLSLTLGLTNINLTFPTMEKPTPGNYYGSLLNLKDQIQI